MKRIAGALILLAMVGMTGEPAQAQIPPPAYGYLPYGYQPPSSRADAFYDSRRTDDDTFGLGDRNRPMTRAEALRLGSRTGPTRELRGTMTGGNLTRTGAPEFNEQVRPGARRGDDRSFQAGPGWGNTQGAPLATDGEVGFAGNVQNLGATGQQVSPRGQTGDEALNAIREETRQDRVNARQTRSDQMNLQPAASYQFEYEEEIIEKPRRDRSNQLEYRRTLEK